MLRTAIQDLDRLRFAGEKCFFSCGGVNYDFSSRFFENDFVPLGISSYNFYSGAYEGKTFLSANIIYELEHKYTFLFRHLDNSELKNTPNIIGSLEEIMGNVPSSIGMIIFNGGADQFALSRKAIGKNGIVGPEFIQWWVSKKYI